ncbi:ribonuclease P protein component [Bifidobacterium xylocopae]|uniref:Ribonuclease P protein component n=1 Tax=Bifidobacterium xylocopae TaxID=2493119 RepID=A0A366KD41_9BIFI|nr:ribonuclease P protein component [Bifidobacterium xylocopae]RBP99665.1 ribonuclease P protein component [Bifidobacterium xylocopae]
MERLKSHQEFTAVLRRRRRVSSRDLVIHLLTGDEAAGNRRAPGQGVHGSVAGRRMGLAVSKAVGNAVTRNRVKRRFRVLAANHEDSLPAVCDLVMRAKPGAARATYRSLDEQVSRLFADIMAKDGHSGPVDGRRINGAGEQM